MSRHGHACRRWPVRGCERSERLPVRPASSVARVPIGEQMLSPIGQHATLPASLTGLAYVAVEGSRKK